MITSEEREATIADWSVAVTRLVERGAEPGLLYEAMVTVAVEGYAETFGLQSADEYLRKLLDDLAIRAAVIPVNAADDDAPLM